jgi:hypothetical protein
MDLPIPLRETPLMGLFGKKKESAPVVPRIALVDRVPSTPKSEGLRNYLTTAGGSYDLLGGGGLADSPMSPEDREVWLQMRNSADKAFKQLRVPLYKDLPNYVPGVSDPRRLGYLVRDLRDPWAIWLEVEGWRVDRLMRSSVEAWEGGPAEPYPVLCSLFIIGTKPEYFKPSVTIHRNKK